MIDVHDVLALHAHRHGNFNNLPAGYLDDLLHLFQFDDRHVLHHVNLPVNDLNPRDVLDDGLSVGNFDLPVNPLNLRDLNNPINDLNFILGHSLLDVADFLLHDFFDDFLVHRNLDVTNVLVFLNLSSAIMHHP